MIAVSDNPTPGVNLIGFLEAESGLGEVARRLGDALDRAGIPFGAIPYRQTPSRQEYPLRFGVTNEAAYDVNLLCLNADDLTAFAPTVGADLFANRYSIGVWFWETNVFRDEDRTASNLLDEVWVASDYVRGAVQAQLDVPVRIFPVPAIAPAGPFRSRRQLGIPDEFTFLFLFDFVSVARKNPVGVIEAFTRAFAPGEGPVLVLKSINGRQRKPREFDELQALASGRPDIVFRDGYVSPHERDSYIAACDCYVSLHHSEGFGLTLAEAMSLGKPVIATGYSGNLEFMNDQNSYLVPHRVVDVPDEWWAYVPGARWAESDLDVAAATMADVYMHEDEARARGEQGRVEILRDFSLDRAADFVRDRFEHARPPSLLISDARIELAALSLALASAPGASLSQGRSWRPAAIARRVLRRALWPYLVDVQRTQSALLETTRRSRRAVTELEARVARLEQSSPRYEPDGSHDPSPVAEVSSLRDD
jgi:glycosyltransferase involved in cell wall biosynthesis